MLQDRRWIMGSKDHAIRQEVGQDKKGIEDQEGGLRTGDGSWVKIMQ